MIGMREYQAIVRAYADEEGFDPAHADIVQVGQALLVLDRVQHCRGVATTQGRETARIYIDRLNLGRRVTEEALDELARRAVWIVTRSFLAKVRVAEATIKLVGVH